MNYRDLPPGAFDVSVHYDNYNDRHVLRWGSHTLSWWRSMMLRGNWDGDVDALVEFVGRLVGGTMAAWFHARVHERDMRDMLEEMVPHFERSIFHRMEELERAGRRRFRVREMRMEPGAIAWAEEYQANARMLLGERFIVDWPETAVSEKANDKAEQLLLRHLDDGQKKSYKRDRTFRVTAANGKVYTIRNQRSFNVEGPDGERYCGQTVDTPIADQMLAQMNLLRHDPDKFFKNANVVPGSTTSAQTAAYAGANEALMYGGRAAPPRHGTIREMMIRYQQATSEREREALRRHIEELQGRGGWL